jgi:hypothetical protein
MSSFSQGYRFWNDYSKKWSIVDIIPHWSAVPLTSLTTGQRCQWHYPPLISGVIDPAHHRSAMLLTPPTICQRCFVQLRSAASLTLPTIGRRCHCGIMLDWGRIRNQIVQSLGPDQDKMAWNSHLGGQCYWDRRPVVSGVNNTAHHRSAAPLKLPTTSQWCYWHR